jgi:hypothetical protein
MLTTVGTRRWPPHVVFADIGCQSFVVYAAEVLEQCHVSRGLPERCLIRSQDEQRASDRIRPRCGPSPRA